MDAIDDKIAWRYPGGYQWLSARRAIRSVPVAKSDMVLTTGLPEGAYHLESYNPPANLFLSFAETKDTQESVKQFADNYGLLGLTTGGAVTVALPSSASGPSETAARGTGRNPGVVLGKGELFFVWCQQIQQVREAVVLWSDLQKAVWGDPTALSRHVRWCKDLVYYDTHPELVLPPLMGIPPSRAPERLLEAGDRKDEPRTVAIIASRWRNSEWLKYFSMGDCVMPAKYYLQRIVNENLKGKASPQLLWNVRRDRPRDLALFFVPGNLLGLIWLQLAEAINGNRQYRHCAGCKTWIVISRETVGSRSSRFTCSDACRMKVYYGRKLEARRLQQQGLGVAEIAQRIKAERRSVRQWITAGGAKSAGGKTVTPRKS
jgi:hypothetical protein